MSVCLTERERVCVWLAGGSNRQEEQVAPRWGLPAWWVRTGGHWPFTIHVPSASAAERAEDGGRDASPRKDWFSPTQAETQREETIQESSLVHHFLFYSVHFDL